MIGPLPYIGGKNRFARIIIPLIPKHLTYVEPFSGGAQMLFHKEPSRVEVLNDLDGDIVNFFRICRHHHAELVRELSFSLVSRKLYAIYTRFDPDTLTDIQRAARFFYLQKNSFGGLVVKRNYHISITGPPNFNPRRIPEILDQAHQRLAKVQIECLPYEQALLKFDRTSSFFFIDPPYYGRKLYRFNFAFDDFHLLAERLRGLAGKFILTLNDLPEVRQIFSAFEMLPISIAYSSQKKAGVRYPELLISNFRLEKNAFLKPTLNNGAAQENA